MAVPYLKPEPLTSDELDQLQLGNSFKKMAELPAWKAVTEYLAEIVKAAQEELLAEITGDLNQRNFLVTRWQQRLAIERELLSFVDSHITAHTEFVNELTPEDDYEHDPE